MKIINLTPHDVVLMNDQGDTKVYGASGVVARTKYEQKVIDTLDGFDVVSIITSDEVIDLPEPAFNTFYIVSNLVKQFSKGRVDLISPNMAQSVKGSDGSTVAVKSWLF